MGAELSSQTNGNFALAGRGACDPGGRDETGGREEGLRLRPTATRSVQAVIRSPDAACRAGGRPRFRLDGCVSGRANDGLHAEAEPLCCVASPTTVACMQLQCSDPRGHCAVAFWVRIKLRRRQQGASTRPLGYLIHFFISFTHQLIFIRLHYKVYFSPLNGVAARQQAKLLRRLLPP